MATDSPSAASLPTCIFCEVEPVPHVDEGTGEIFHLTHPAGYPTDNPRWCLHHWIFRRKEIAEARQRDASGEQERLHDQLVAVTLGPVPRHRLKGSYQWTEAAFRAVLPEAVQRARTNGGGRRIRQVDVAQEMRLPGGDGIDDGLSEVTFRRWRARLGIPWPLPDM